MFTLVQSLKHSRLVVLIVLCVAALTATSVFASGPASPSFATTVYGNPDAAVNGKLAVGSSSVGSKSLTVSGVIDFVGAGTVHNYFSQGGGNNMQINTNVDEANAVGDASKSQWKLVLGSSLDQFSIRRSPAGGTYNEDALFFVDGATGNVSIATVDTGNGGSIPFSPQARLHVRTSSGNAIRAESTQTSGTIFTIIAQTSSTSGRGVVGEATATSGSTQGVWGLTHSPDGTGVLGSASGTTGSAVGVYGLSSSTAGIGVNGLASATTGTTYGVYGQSSSAGGGTGVYGLAIATGGSTTNGVYGRSNSYGGMGVRGYAASTAVTSTFGVYGSSESIDGTGVGGFALASTGTNWGVFGKSFSTNGYDFYAGGVGTNYGPFTGAHEVKLDDVYPTEVKPGLIVSVAGQTEIRQADDGSVSISSTLPTVRLSDRANDPAVFGAVVSQETLPKDHWYQPKPGERFASVNALGEGRVWVSNINGDVQVGDYITTSTIPGYGQRQYDDLLHSYTLGKATETIDWSKVKDTVQVGGQTYKVYLLAVVYTSG